MKKETSEYIKILAERVRATFNVSIPILNIDSIIKSMGGDVEEVDAFTCFHDGTVAKTSDYTFAIRIPKHFESREERTFVLTKELGHVLLHLGRYTDYACWSGVPENKFFRFDRYDAEEQADEFACDFLMPEDEVRSVVAENVVNGFVNIGAVADYFNVSKNKAIYRATMLSIIGPTF